MAGLRRVWKPLLFAMTLSLLGASAFVKEKGLLSRTSLSLQKVAIVGGGLAGLSTAYHLLEQERSLKITIFDKTPVGRGGASAVAGG